MFRGVTSTAIGLSLLTGCGLWVSRDAPCDPEHRVADRYFTDADGDGFGDADRPLDCGDVDLNLSYVPNAYDCDDTVPNRERPTTLWYLDPDRDGYGTGEDCELDADHHRVAGDGCIESCDPPEGYGAADIGDCVPDDGSWSRICPWIQESAGWVHSCGVRSDRRIQCWGDDGYGQSSPPDDSDFVQVSAGYVHTCGLHATGAVTCWGIQDGSSSDHGQVTDTPDATDFQSVSAGGFHTCGLHTNGEVECWGDDDNLQVSDIPAPNLFESVAAGANHSCGLRASGEISCWGSDSQG